MTRSYGFNRFLTSLVLLLGVTSIGQALLVAQPAGAAATTTAATTTTEPAEAGGLFVASSGRLLNTMNGVGGYTTPMPAAGWRTIAPLGTNGIPTSGVSAVQVALVAYNPSTSGTVQVRPTGAAAPGTTSLYYTSSLTGSQTNTTIVELAADGTFQVKADTSINFLIDVEGYFTAGAPAAGGYVPITPERIVDTRSGLGLPQTTLAGGSTSSIDVAGLAGVPANASAAFINFDVVNRSTTAGHIQPYAAGTNRVGAGLSFPGSVTTSVSGTVPLGTGVDAGKINVYVAGGSIDLVVDVVGYYTSTDAPGDSASSTFTPSAMRLVNGYQVPGNTTVDIAIQGQGPSNMPTYVEGLAAVALNLQVRNYAATGGHVRMWADDQDKPGTAVLSYQPSVARSNFTTVAVGENGGIKLYNGGSNPITVYLDLQGWYQWGDPGLLAEPVVPSEGTETPTQEEPNPGDIAGIEQSTGTTVTAQRKAVTVCGTLNKGQNYGIVFLGKYYKAVDQRAGYRSCKTGTKIVTAAKASHSCNKHGFYTIANTITKSTDIPSVPGSGVPEAMALFECNFYGGVQIKGVGIGTQQDLYIQMTSFVKNGRLEFSWRRWTTCC